MNTKAILPLVIISVLIGCGGLSRNKTSNAPLEVIKEDHVGNRHKILLTDLTQSDYWAKTNPILFLEFLQKSPDALVSVLSPPPGWINEKHVEQLMKFIDSRKPASIVISAIAATLPTTESSTVGEEAMFLIEGFRKGRYPPLVSSADFVGNAGEIKSWWRELKQKTPTGK